MNLVVVKCTNALFKSQKTLVDFSTFNPVMVTHNTFFNITSGLPPTLRSGSKRR
ncbi:hypothetical protein HanPI659440_Chr03g0128131 [Helianthus annuus]|nr:hypothetical protein HanPI659440_Chr03g0128131 [Helianthus annuus]